MTNQIFTSLDQATTVSDGPSFTPPVFGRAHMSVQASGILAGDIVQVQASNDGVNWDAIGDDITADGVYAVELGAVHYRASLTNITGGGTITGIFAGYSS